ncbi:MAG: 50S ribosomal protein L13 [bacterium]
MKKVKKVKGTFRTYSAKQSEVIKKWYHIDATGKTLGRLATKVVSILRGKDKPIFTPHVDTGDFVIITNAEKILVTGKKMEKKIYYHHSGYPGGLKETPLNVLMKRFPEKVIIHAVRGMLPKGILGRRLITKLKVYAGDEHPHEVQQPITIELI